MAHWQNYTGIYRTGSVGGVLELVTVHCELRDADFLNALELSPGTEVYSQNSTGVSRMGWSRAVASKMLTPSQVPASSWLPWSSCPAVRKLVTMRSTLI